MKLKNNGWAIQFDGTKEGAEKLVKKMWGDKYNPKSPASFFAHKDDRATVLTESYDARTIYKGQWLALYDGSYTIEDFIPEGWKEPPEDGMSPTARSIWNDWIRSAPYLGRR